MELTDETKELYSDLEAKENELAKLKPEKADGQTMFDGPWIWIWAGVAALAVFLIAVGLVISWQGRDPLDDRTAEQENDQSSSEDIVVETNNEEIR